MNEKNKRKRASATLDRKWHMRLKVIASKRNLKIEDVLDDAASFYLKAQGPVRMIRATE